MSIARLMFAGGAVAVLGVSSYCFQAWGQGAAPVPAPAITTGRGQFAVYGAAGAAQIAPGGAPGFPHVIVAPGHGPQADDPETNQLLEEEKNASQQAQELTQRLPGAEAGQRDELKGELKAKLTEVFDLQQKRRSREIARIEERLAKLKDLVKKRDTSKESIIDRRLEQLTGGVDELGWEETGGQPGAFGIQFGSGFPTPTRLSIPATPRGRATTRPAVPGSPDEEVVDPTELQRK